MQRLTPALLRAAALGALLLLLWNPGTWRRTPASAPPIVLLDASLSMAAGGGGAGSENVRWRGALDSARVWGGPDALIWRFGDRVAAFDSAAPGAGTSRLAPALEAAAGRGSDVIVVTDGELTDVATLAPDLARRPRVVLLPRAPARDAFIQSVRGPTSVAADDTVRLAVHYGSAGPAASAGRASGPVTLVAALGGRELATRRIALPDSGVLETELTFPAARLPAGWVAVDVALRGAADPEPRDDARVHLLEVSREPQAVLLAAPPDWDSRFLAAVLDDVAGVPLRVFVDAGGAPGSWRDARTLAPTSPAVVRRAVASARLVVLAGDERRWSGLPRGRATLLLPAPQSASAGEWYMEAPRASPLAARLAGIDWSALPPATALAAAPTDPEAAVVIGAALARRGPPRPAVLVRDSAGRRSATILAEGLWRWRFRGGADAVAYRTLVAALVDWLLSDERRARRNEQFVPLARTVPNGMPIMWRWVAATPPGGPVPVRFEPLASGDSAAPSRTDTLVFGAAGGAETFLPPGVYRYTAAGAPAGGLVAVETYSDEWRPRPLTLRAQPGAAGGQGVRIGARDRWWLFALVIAAFVAEWAWRRRQGLP